MEYRTLGRDEIPEDGDQIQMFIGRPQQPIWLDFHPDPGSDAPVHVYGTALRRPLPEAP